MCGQFTGIWKGARKAVKDMAREVIVFGCYLMIPAVMVFAGQQDCRKA